MTKTVTIAATRTGGDPYAHHDVIVTLVAGSAGGVVGSNVIVEQSTVKLNASGTGSITLRTNDVEITSPSTSFYRFTVEGSSPTITRSIRLTDDLPSSVSWTLADIQVGDPTIPQRDVSSNYVTVPGGGSLTNRLANTPLLDQPNEFTAAQSIDVAVPVTPIADIATTKPTILAHLHGGGGAVVDHFTITLDIGGGVIFKTAGTLSAVIGTDGEPTDEWVAMSIGPTGPAILSVTSTDPGELPFIGDILTSTPKPLVVGTPTDNAHAATKAYVDAGGGGGVSLGETSSTAYRGDHGKTAYDHSQVTSGNPHGTTATDVGAQPADSDLTAIAALTTTSYGRAFLALADAAAGRTALGLGTAALSATGDFAAAGHDHAGTYQPLDSDLTALAALTTTAFGRALLELADAAAGRTALGTAYGLTASTVVEGIALPRKAWRAGSYYATDVLPSNSGNNIASGQVKAMGFYNPVAGRPADQIAIDVHTGSAGSGILYICTDDGTGYPGAVVASGAMSTPMTSTRSTTSISYTLPRGQLWLVAHGTGTTWAGLALFGQSFYMPAPSAYSANPISCWNATGAGTSALTSFPAGATAASSGVQILVRAA